MNIDWALKDLNNFAYLTERVPYPSPNIIGRFSRGSKTEIVFQAQVAKKIMDLVTPGWCSELISVKPGTWDRYYGAVVRTQAQLQRAEEVSRNPGENAPALSAAELRPRIWDGAKSLWQSDHCCESIGGAIRKLNAETQNKIGRRDVSETNLFKQSFSTDQSKEDSSRLRRMKDDGSDTYKSVQGGAMTFAEGVFAGIRNPLSNEADHELNEQEALEYLAALSVLARWVDNSSVEVAS